MTIYSVYDQIAEMLASVEPTRLLHLRATPEMQLRLERLIEKSKSGHLEVMEKDELDHYIVLERLIRLAKIRARGHASF